MATAGAPQFAEIMRAVWEASLRYGIDPVGAVAQAWKETGRGTFERRPGVPGAVRAEFRNPCGLKIRHPGLFPGVTDGDEPLAHAMFGSWETGAHAHVQHLCAYAGQPLPAGTIIVDPRYTLVRKPYAETFEELSGRWAPSPTYGQELVQIARHLQGVATT